MPDQPATSLPPEIPGSTGLPRPRSGRAFAELFALRKEAPAWQFALLGALCVALCLGLWWFVTRGEPEERLVPYGVLPSPGETFATFHKLWFDRALTRNTLATLRRVGLGFGLAALVGVPVGVLCGCFSRAYAFFLPLTIFGRNIPIAALIGLLIAFFDIGELGKVMFIFIACVAFVVSDTARAVIDVGTPYVDTAYTLGARRRQIIFKVLVPLALPGVFNSLRLLFGLAFGYIMLAELTTAGEEVGGLGNLINVSMRRGPREHVFLILLLIPLVALGIDRLLFWVQRELFPYRYGGAGLLYRGVRALFHGWEDLKSLVRKPAPAPGLVAAAAGAARQPPP